MIAQLNSHPDNTSVTRGALLHNYSATPHNQIRIVETFAVDKASPVENRFCTEIVADALKIASTGQRVLIVQLLKGGIRQGHDRVVNLAQNLDWIRCNLIRNISIADLNDLELHNFQQLWKHVCSVARMSEYSLLILDDLSLSIELGLISIESATNFLTTLPENLDVILAGTNPHPAILELAA
ncbi:cob(I)yrinic acid a,c-diamide adenosyltransferase [Chamaesiphon sp. VAR_48_metabat_135_sub]|uniref:cob(I)yrinic acid a,c-diamide adenosyltransferase n=1 Tax=Chamaesiphon sp. VAR_48_metabat_135_sub TaxID=2964699 RepID=UPI00286AF4E7|nr:cob(I)yrinic acid a,c-diamide adenosyltransferase [Chamaesiphon sp. VAR_48_metabat_135_sub]